MGRTVVHRYSGALGGSLLSVALGLAYATPALFVLALVPLGYVAAGALSRFPEPTLSVERSLSPAVPAPGETVTVTLSVENTSDRTLPDVRVVDGVPEELVVPEGVARGCLSLSPGETRSFSYELLARRGTHAFSEPTVRCRSLLATRLVTTTVEAGGERSLRCERTVEQSPPTRPSRSRIGSLPTDSGGSGIAFHSTREYRSGDPINRIDWRRLARTDELSTINFRRQQAARVVLAVDAYPSTRVAPEAGYPSGVELAAYAAERTYDSLTAAGHRVAVAALGLDEETLPWVPADDGTAADARRLFDRVQVPTAVAHTTAVDGPVDPDPSGETARALLARLPPDAQVVYCSPLLSDRQVSVVEGLRERGYPVSVVSPDTTVSSSVGGRLTAVERADRIAALRARGVTVVDWELDRRLDDALTRSLRAVVRP